MGSLETDYELAGQMIGCAMEVQRKFGAGLCETVYKRALRHELQLREFEVEEEKKSRTFYKGIAEGDFAADLVVKHELIVELKAVTQIVPADEVRLVNYHAAPNFQEGPLFNFGNPMLQFKKEFKSYQPKTEATGPPKPPPIEILSIL